MKEKKKSQTAIVAELVAELAKKIGELADQVRWCNDKISSFQSTQTGALRDKDDQIDNYTRMLRDNAATLNYMRGELETLRPIVQTYVNREVIDRLLLKPKVGPININEAQDPNQTLFRPRDY